MPGCGLQDEKANFELIGERANERERERKRWRETERECQVWLEEAGWCWNMRGTNMAPVSVSSSLLAVSVCDGGALLSGPDGVTSD